MVKVFEGTDYEYTMDGYIVANLDIAIKEIRKDWDMVFCVDGGEGVGKSVFAMQLAFYCDQTFNLSRISFTPEAFKKSVLSAEKYQAILYDEGFSGLNSRATMSIVNKTLVSMLAEIRQKNLFVFVVAPTFFDLDRYLAIWRSRALFHCYSGNDFERGMVAFYNSDKKKELYMNGKKFYSYYKPMPNFRSRFSNHYVVSEVAYRNLKYKALQDREVVETIAEGKTIRNALIQYIYENKYMNHREIAEYITQKSGVKITRQGITNLLKRGHTTHDT